MVSTLTVLALVGQAYAAPTGGRDRLRAVELLSRAQRGDFGVNVRGILEQRDPSGTGMQTVKVVRSKDGKQRCTIVAPLRYAHIESVDDGTRKKTYLPDDKVILDEDSSASGEGALTGRMKLAKQNYTFSMETVPDMVGREAIVVTARPRSSDLDTRRYYLDSKTCYPLKLEILRDSSEPQTMFQIKWVEYPDSLPSNAFKLEVLPDVTKIRYDRPKKSDKAAAVELVGFVPIMPGPTPFGFKVQETQLNRNDDWKSVVVRLTDGLAWATVYEWVPDGKPKRVMGDSTSRDIRGIRVLVVTELGPKVRNRILDAFEARRPDREEPNSDPLAARALASFSLIRR